MWLKFKTLKHKNHLPVSVLVTGKQFLILQQSIEIAIEMQTSKTSIETNIIVINPNLDIILSKPFRERYLLSRVLDVL